MRGTRDPIVLVAGAVALAVAIGGGISAFRWIGTSFPGFLILENRVVASAGLAAWEGTRGGEIFQHEVVAVDGRPLGDARELAAIAADRGPGAPIRYELRRDGTLIERTIATRHFGSGDFLLLFGSYLLCGIGLTGTAVLIRFLGAHDPRTFGSALSLWITGMWALTALDLYGPYRLFRLHFFFECLLFAGALHMALVFPTLHRLAARRRWIPFALYGAALALAGAGQIALADPAAYARVHRVAVTAFGLALLVFVGAQVAAFVRPPSFAARQRVKVLALGALAALLPQVAVSLGSAWSGGRAPENAMGWSGVFFPVAVAYAVLRDDLLEVDAILRRSINYALLTGAVAAAYGIAATSVEAFLPRGDAGSGGMVALAFAAVSVGLLLPLRDRVQAGVDRVFYRSAYDFRRLVEETSKRLASIADLDVVTIEVCRAVSEALQPEWLVFEARRPEAREVDVAQVGERAPGVTAADLEAARIANAPLDAAGDALVVPFCLEGRLSAVLVLGRRLSGRFFSGYDRQLLRTLANQGALAVENALALIELRGMNRNLERIVDERTAELSHALRELRETQGQLAHQQKMASVGRLVAGVAHEINNPLNFVHGNMYHLREHARALAAALSDYEETLRTGGGEAAVTRVRESRDLDFVLGDLGSVFDACGEGIERTLAIVKDLRTFSRLDSGSPSAVDLIESLESTLTLLGDRLRPVAVSREYEELPPVECLEGQIRQVFMNLLSNAADAVGDGGRIVIRAQRAAPDRVAIEIEDDGCGIAAEHLDSIFEPFFTTKEVGRGTGLGLAISFGIVARHSGRFLVRSEIGRGSCFRLELPTGFQPSGHG
jgi:two-component system NtrC family sensor kinase